MEHHRPSLTSRAIKDSKTSPSNGYDFSSFMRVLFPAECRKAGYLPVLIAAHTEKLAWPKADQNTVIHYDNDDGNISLVYVSFAHEHKRAKLFYCFLSENKKQEHKAYEDVEEWVKRHHSDYDVKRRRRSLMNSHGDQYDLNKTANRRRKSHRGNVDRPLSWPGQVSKKPRKPRQSLYLWAPEMTRLLRR